MAACPLSPLLRNVCVHSAMTRRTGTAAGALRSAAATTASCRTASPGCTSCRAPTTRRHGDRTLRRQSPVQDNVIGVDSLGSGVGVCGQGIRCRAAARAFSTTASCATASASGYRADRDPGERHVAALRANHGAPQSRRQRAGRRLCFRARHPTGAANLCPGAHHRHQRHGRDRCERRGQRARLSDRLLQRRRRRQQRVLTYLGQTTADSNGLFAFTLSQPLAQASASARAARRCRPA